MVSNADSAGSIVSNTDSAGFILQVFTQPGCSRLLSLVSLSSCTVSLLCGVMYLREYYVSIANLVTLEMSRNLARKRF